MIEGTLIQTSNRVGTFDEAFKSRIQVANHYNNLTRSSRKSIWKNVFDMIEESPDEGDNLAKLEGKLDELAKEDMNADGSTAGEAPRERLDWSHFNQVIKTSAEFQRYLFKVKGHSDDQWAREESLR